MIALLLAAALQAAQFRESTNVMALASSYCSYTNAPCDACVVRAANVVSRRNRPKLPDGMKPAKPKEPAIHILGRKYPVKGRKK